MTSQPWRLVLLLAGIFLAGGVVGGFLTFRFAHQKMRERGAPEHWGPARLKMLADRLDLTPDQVGRLKPIVRRDVEDLNRLRQQSFSETRRILERMERDIAAVLAPEQKRKFEQLNRDLRERARRMFEQRRNERREGRDGRPPGPEGMDGPPPPPPGDERK
ncbi:MAG: hypothetical protein C0502_09290 [Opitutus sp.]|nr:hypothetical protein [Opitutus sp.]